MDPIERHLSVRSIKDILDCSRTKAYEVALECGGVKDGRFLRVPESALKGWMEARRQSAVPAAMNTVELKCAIVRAGTTQRAISMDLGIPETEFSHMIRGRRPFPEDVKPRLAELLGRGVVDLFPPEATPEKGQVEL